MARLEELKRGAVVKGILPDGFVTVVDVKWIGSVAIELTYKDSQGKLGNELIYRDREVVVVLQQQAIADFMDQQSWILSASAETPAVSPMR